MHPGLLRLFLGLSMILADGLFNVVLITIGKESPNHRYLCKETTNITVNSSNHFNDEICWSWKFDSNGSCMFNLLFASTICLHLTIFIFFTSSFLKCLFPELALVAQRSLFFRCIGRYFSVALNFAAFVVAAALLVYVGVHDSSNSQCKDTGHLWRNCKDKSNACWVFAIFCLGCLFSYVGVLLSAHDARMMYLGRRDFEEEEQIYQRYVDYDAVKDLDSY